MQCFSNLAPERYITKETKCCQWSLLTPVSFCQKPNILICRTKGHTWNRHGCYIVVTLIIRLTEVNGPWLEFSECASGHWPILTGWTQSWGFPLRQCMGILPGEKRLMLYGLRQCAGTLLGEKRLIILKRWPY